EVGSVGVRTALGGIAFEANAAKDFAGGEALSLGAASRVKGVSLVAKHVEYSGLFYDETSIGSASGTILLRRSDELRVATLVRPAHNGVLPLSFPARGDERADESVLTSAVFRPSTWVDHMFVSNSVNWQEDRKKSQPPQPAWGETDVTASPAGSKWRVR